MIFFVVDVGSKVQCDAPAEASTPVL